VIGKNQRLHAQEHLSRLYTRRNTDLQRTWADREGALPQSVAPQCASVAIPNKKSSQVFPIPKIIRWERGLRWVSKFAKMWNNPSHVCGGSFWPISLFNQGTSIRCLDLHCRPRKRVWGHLAKRKSTLNSQPWDCEKMGTKLFTIASCWNDISKISVYIQWLLPVFELLYIMYIIYNMYIIHASMWCVYMCILYVHTMYLYMLSLSVRTHLGGYPIGRYPMEYVACLPFNPKHK